MSSSGNLQSLVKTDISVPRHQSIGKNGSFWIPKDSPDLLKQKSLPKKSSPIRTGTSAKANNSNQATNQSDLRTEGRVTTNFEKSMLSAEKKYFDKPRPPQSHSIAKNINTTASKPSQSNLPLLSLPTKTVNSSVLITQSSSSTIVGKDSLKPPNATPVNPRVINRDGGNQEHGKKKKNHGAKNAQMISSMDIKENEATNSVPSASNLLKADSPVVERFIKFVSKSVSPRVSYTHKFAKKIVRFAFDLPNGGKLGVRLEKSDKGISLCFIAAEEDIRNLLSFCKGGLADRIKSEQSTDVNLHIFSDYKEMDNYFLKVA